MKLIIAGSRAFADYQHAEVALLPLLEGGDVDEVISGGAYGADAVGEAWANEHGIPVTVYLPDLKKHGKKAGILRNVEMAKEADALVAFWDGKSRGTKHMIEEAKRQGLKVQVVYFGAKPAGAR
jgi:hypothetical protein